MEIELIKGDITKIKTDAIVNAANSSLLGGGGVDGAIHRSGGPAILEECRIIRNRQGGCQVGEAVITTAGNLPARHVIHTVGPVWQGGQQEEHRLLSQCYSNALALAEKNQLSSIAFPNVSTGIYKFPKQKAAQIALEAVRDYAQRNTGIEKVIFVCFDEENHAIYEDMLVKSV